MQKVDKQPILLYTALIELFVEDPKVVQWYAGEGNQGLLSDLSGLVASWVFYMCMINALYFVIGKLMRIVNAIVWPDHGTNFVPKEVRQKHIALSSQAFPLYVFVPVLGDLARKKGLSRTCDTVDECGGYGMSMLNFVGFFVMLEFLVFFDHYYILHVWLWGKKNLNHDLHHQYELADEMTSWTGYAFDALDGFSQGFPLVICQMIFAIPLQWYITLTTIIGIWTMYIHCGTPTLPWPFMGADYHFIHHRFNWYNFGFFTMTFDYLFGVLRHPQPRDFDVDVPIVSPSLPPSMRDKLGDKKD